MSIASPNKQEQSIKTVLFQIIILSCIVGFPVCVAQTISTQQPQKRAIRGCWSAGFFSEFLWVLNHIEWCVATGRIPIVDWDNKSAYYCPEGYNGYHNVWEYYFAPVSTAAYLPEDKMYRKFWYNNYFSTVWEYVQYIDKLYLLSEEDRKCCISVPGNDYSKIDSWELRRNTYPCITHPYDKQFRKYVKNELIDKFITIRPQITAKIDKFWTKNMKGKKVIGILPRENIWGETLKVPYMYLFDEAKKHIKNVDKYFVVTDRASILEAAKKFFGEKLIFYEWKRPDIPFAPSVPGSMGPLHGENILIEAMLLSRCSHFIHTLSCISTAVLYFNPDLPHTLIY